MKRLFSIVLFCLMFTVPAFSQEGWIQHPIPLEGSGSPGSGDVAGPSSAIDSDIACFDTTTGKLIKDCGLKFPSMTKGIVLWYDTNLAALAPGAVNSLLGISSTSTPGYPFIGNPLTTMGNSPSVLPSELTVKTYADTKEVPLTFSAPLDRATNTISIPAATATTNGYLGSGDWSNFDSKQAGDTDLTAIAAIAAAKGYFIYYTTTWAGLAPGNQYSILGMGASSVPGWNWIGNMSTTMGVGQTTLPSEKVVSDHVAGQFASPPAIGSTTPAPSISTNDLITKGPWVDVRAYKTGGSGTSGNPWTGWDTAITWAANTTYVFPYGYYSYTDSPNFALAGIRLIGLGNPVLKHTGTGNAFIVDGGAAGSGVFNVGIEGITIWGQANSTNGLYIRSVHHSVFKDIRVSTISASALYLVWNTANTFINFTNDNANEPHDFSPVPTFGITIDERVHPEHTTACSFINPILYYYGSGMALYIKAGNFNTFQGGMFGSAATGIQIDAQSNDNKFINSDIENNSTQNVLNNGRFNFFDTIYADGVFNVGTSADTTLLISGQYDSIIIASGAVGTDLVDLNYNATGAGGVITDNGTRTTKRNVRNMSTGVFDINIIGKDLSIIDDAFTTNTTLDLLTIQRTTTGTAGDGIGAALKFMVEDASGNLEEAGRIDTAFDVAAHATQTGRMSIRPFGATGNDGLHVVKNAAGITNVGIGTIVPPEKLFTAGTVGIGSYTDVSNMEYMKVQQTAGNIAFTVMTAGTGTDNIDITLTPAGTGRLQIGSKFEVLPAYYGVSWDESADTYARTGSTAGQATGTTLADALLPIQRQMRRCVMNDAGVVQYYLDPTDSTKKANGGSSVLTGADGQVMVEVPKFYYRHSYVGTTHTWEISLSPLQGFDLHPAFIKNGIEVPYRYIRAYEGVLYDVSASIYANGIYQTAFSCTFANADSSITANARSNPFTGLEVGDKITISGTTLNNGTFTVASIVSDVKITTSEALTDETAASTVIETQKDWTATSGDKLSSVSGKKPITYGTRAQFRVSASNRGAGWRSLDWDLMSAIQLLYLIEYASFYSQSMIGAGITNVSGWDTYNDYNPIAKTGQSNSVGNATGNTAGSTSAATESTKYLVYRGIEQWFGHLWKWIDGININNNRSYVTNNSNNWADDTSTNYTDLGVSQVASDGWQSTLINISRGFLPASVGAGSTTKITDYYYQSSGWRVAIVGGGAGGGSSAGAFYLALYGSSGYARRDVGGRACF